MERKKKEEKNVKTLKRLNRWVGEWMSGWMTRWMNGWMDGWNGMDGRMGGMKK